MIPTPHIEVKDANKIAKTVLMPGDPLRAKYIADTFLENVEQFNGVRGMLGFTGTYKGRRISVMGSGMGKKAALLDVVSGENREGILNMSKEELLALLEE